MAKKDPLVTTTKIKGKIFYFIDGVGPLGPHVEVRGDNVRLINPNDEETPKRDMSYVGSAIKLMVEANQ